PLLTVHRAKIAALVRPFVPDADAAVLEIFDICVAGEKPEQFVDDRLQVQLLRREHRKAFAQIEAHLMAENGNRADAAAVALFHPIRKDVLHQFEILTHQACLASTTQDGQVYPCPQPRAGSYQPRHARYYRRAIGGTPMTMSFDLSLLARILLTLNIAGWA